jgi:hypothetical protein
MSLTIPRRALPAFFLVLALFPSLLLPVGCKRFRHHGSEDVVYVVAKETFLRDRVAAVSNKVATVVNGQRLVVLERGKRFVRVRTEKGEVGWLEEHAVIDQATAEAFQTLEQQHAHDPVVATGIVRDEVYAHLQPGRDTERFMLLPENDKLQLLERASVPHLTPDQSAMAAARKQQRARMEAAATRAAKAQADKEAAAKKGTSDFPKPPAAPSAPAGAFVLQPEHLPKPDEPPPPLEDWWLVRDSAGRVGWLLARRMDVDIPEEVVRYAEGQKIVGAYLLAKVPDQQSPFPDHEAPEYVVVLNPYKDGLPYDFSQLRVFVWNAKKHRYEGGLRQKDLVGYLPVVVKHQQATPGGPSLPVFTVRLAAEGADPELDPTTGRIVKVPTVTQSYRLEGELVKRVLAPGEAPAAIASSASPEEQKRRKERAAAKAKWRAEHPKRPVAAHSRKKAH